VRGYGGLEEVGDEGVDTDETRVKNKHLADPGHCEVRCESAQRDRRE